MADSDADQELADRYRSYLDLCNRGAFDSFDAYVADEVTVSGEVLTRSAYAEAVAGVRAAFPDLRWEIHHLVVNRPLLAAQLIGTGTHTGADWLGRPAAGARVSIPEQALYAWSGGRIREVWSITDRLETLRQLGDTETWPPAFDPSS